MASTSIAQNLAFVNWTVLTGLALGSYGAVVLLRRRTSATSGFLGFTAACAVVFGLLAWLSDGALPLALVDSPVVDDPAWTQPRATALLAFCGLAALAIVVRRVRAAAGGWLELAALGCRDPGPRLRGPVLGRRDGRRACRPCSCNSSS